ncbi:ABC transporter substrate-binding protein [Streptomyces sp. H27-D2]|uniref:ABC transporter substrate-binding protein n=1 Tax=Streptomyces sp. H27-D2 TaxID=3046304 RepID=UPI002DB59A05|nr:ABC transporter substrate-binding protein [Streptomyces sp. H27-D2]MEC4016685.1 ABC transporter substrate-binding protein [Streptomyces sp. H27-D2]
MNRKTLVLPALVGLLAPVLAACGGSGGAGDGGDPIVVGTTDRIARTGDAPAPLDPAAAYDVNTWNVLGSSFQTLMTLPRSGTEPVPEAASSCSFRDQQNEQYRCSLRRGLKFSNGHALTAQDVKFSIERTLRIQFKSGPVGLMSGIDKVETPSDSEIVFHLKAPDATFPQKLATPAAAIVDSEVYNPKALNKGFEMVGSGPYSVEVEEKDGRILKAVFSKNPNYKGGLELKNDKVEMAFFDDSDSMQKALSKGDIDVVNRSLSPQQIDTLQKSDQKGVELVEMPGKEIRYLAFNTEDRRVKSKAVRQAMARIVDRQALVRDVYERTGDPLYSMVPSGLTGHVNSFYNVYKEPSVAAARQTLKDAGVRTPVKLTFTYTTDHYGPATGAEFKELQRQFNATGLFDIDVKGMKWEEFRPAAVKQEFPVYGMGWYPDFPDPETYIAPFSGKDNFLGTPYRNSDIESTLIPRTRQEAERNGAVPSFKKAQNIIAEDVPLLPLWQGRQYVAARDDITGVEWAISSASLLQLWELGRGVQD